MAAQGAALSKQAHIYQRHMNDFTIKRQEEEERVRDQDRQREEVRRVQG